MSAVVLLFTCEHGGRRVPGRYAGLFRGRQGLLRSHRGYDAGALVTARRMARNLGAPLFGATVTRLLVDLNRKETNHRVFSEVTRGLDRQQRAALLAEHHRPHRERVRTAVDRAVAGGRRVVLVASHSFVPVLDGRRRDFEVGLLYDPARRRETRLCLAWQRALVGLDPQLRVRRNRPYPGRTDGLATWLRGQFSSDRFCGIELEVNQALLAHPAGMAALRRRLTRSLRTVIDSA